MEKNTLLVISFSLLEILQTLRFTSICYGSHSIKLSPLVFEAMLPSQKLVYIIDVTHHDLGQEHVFEGYVSQLIWHIVVGFESLVEVGKRCFEIIVFRLEEPRLEVQRGL